MAIDAGGTLCFHLLVCGLRRCAGRLGILVAIPAGDAVPILERHARIVGHDLPALVEFLDRRVVILHLCEHGPRPVIHVRPHRQMEVAQVLGDVAVLAARIGPERAIVRGLFQLLIRVGLGMAAHAELGPGEGMLPAEYHGDRSDHKTCADKQGAAGQAPGMP